MSWKFLAGDGVDRSVVYTIDYGNDVPFHYQGADGAPAGLAVDMVREAARLKNIRLNWAYERNGTGGEPHPLRVLISIRTNLSKNLHITEPYLQGRSSFIVPSNAPIRTVRDLEGKRISHANYAIHRTNLSKLLQSFTPVPAPDSRGAMENLLTGRADAAFMNDYAVEPAFLSVPLSFPVRILPSGAPVNRMALAARLEYAQVAEVLREGIRELAVDGRMEQIVDRWGFFPNLTTDRREELIKEKRKVLWLQITAVFLLLMVSLSAWLIARLRTEKLLARRAERIQSTTLDALPAHIALLDAEGNIVSVNQSWRNFARENVRFSPNYNVGHNYLDSCEEAIGDSSPGAETASAGIRRVLQGKCSQFIREYPCHSPSEQRWFRLVVTPLSLTDRNGVVVMHIDITERKLSELALQASERKSRAIVESTPVPMAVNDHQHRITFLNNAFIKTYGYTLADIPTLSEWWPKAYPDPIYREWVIDAWQAELTRTRESGREFQPMELRIRTKQGTDRVALAAASFFQDSRQAEHLVALFDITERKQAEEALRQSEAQFVRAQRMESIGTLAGGVAHDLNNVLAPILMSLELLKHEESSESDRNLLETLRTSAEHGAGLVRQLLSFARGLEGERLNINPAHLVNNVQQMIRDTFPKNIEFTCTFPRQSWFVIGDPTQLHQVIMNLCVNARDAMPQGGTLALTIENQVIDEAHARLNPEFKAGSFVVIKVTDTGTGIPREIREKIFEPFFTTKDFGKGTGLGLSTTLAIIKSHGGFIGVESEVGRGTQFKVYLPGAATSPTPQPSPAEANKPVAGNHELILVVDDEPAIRKVAQATLEHFGYRTFSASNGREAVAIYSERKSEIAVVLTDMSMPVMDGPATILALREINPTVKIIGMSGFTSAGNIETQPQNSLRYFIPKPYTAQILLETVRSCLNEKAV